MPRELEEAKKLIETAQDAIRCGNLFSALSYLNDAIRILKRFKHSWY